MVLDQSQLFGEPPLRLVTVRGACRVTLVETRATQLGERPRRGCVVGAVEIGEAIPPVAREIEAFAALREGQCSIDSIWTVTKQLMDIFRRTQEELTVGTADVVGAIQRRPVTDRHQHVVQAVTGAGVIMHVARRYDAKSYVSCKVDQRAGEPLIAPDVVTLDLDEEPVAPEHGTAPLGEPARRPAALCSQGRREQPLPAAGQHDESRVPG